MIPTVTILPTPSNKGSQIGLSRHATNVARGIGNAPTTQVPASGGIGTLTFITRCRNAFTHVILSIWTGITKRIWAFLSAPFRCRSITVAERLLTFKKLVENAYGVCDPDNRKGSQLLLLETQLGIAYKELPVLIQLEITNRMLHPGMGIIPTVDIIYHTLPSVELGHLETELSEGRTDENKLDTLGSMVCIVTSKLETDVTEEFLNARVFAAFNGLSDSLKERIEEKMRNPLHSTEKEGLVNYEGKLSLMIDQQMVSIADPNFTSLVLKTMPRSQRVRAVVLRVRMDLVTRSECASPKRGFN